MQHAKKVISWMLSVCLVLSLLVGVQVPVRAAENGKIKVTCVGDSITAGYKSTNGQSYPTQLQALLGDGYEVLNVGSSGSTVRRSVDEAYSKTNKYKTGLASNPDIVIIMIGTNDSVKFNLKSENTDLKAEFRRDYAALIEEYQNCGTNPKIILGLPTTSVSEKNVEDDRDDKNEAFVIPIIKELAAEYKLQLLDTHTYTGAWVRESSGQRYNYLADGLHPNNAGYGKLADFFANAVLGYTQKFTGDLQVGTNYTITARSSGQALTVADYSADNNAGLCQMQNKSYESQVWKLIANADGYYQFENLYSGKVLDVPNSSTEQSTQIVQFDKGTGDNQKFMLESTGDGYWRITPKVAPDMALNVSGNSNDSGAAVVQWPYGNGSANAQWRIQEVTQTATNPNQPGGVALSMLAMEAEVGTLANGAQLTATDESSNGYYVGFIGGAGNGTLTFNVNAETAGMRTLNIYYATFLDRSMDVIVNGTSTQVAFAANGSWTKPSDQPAVVRVKLNEGANTIQFAGVNNGDAPNIDRVEIALTETEMANTVTGLINTLPTNVLNSDRDKSLITGVEQVYNSLSAEVKKNVTNVSKLTAAVEGLKEATKTPEEIEADNKAAAQPVIDKIAALGTITLQSENSIKDARAAYDALTAAQQQYVTNYSVLQNAETTLNQLKDNAAQEQKDQAAAKTVTDAIAALGMITLESEDGIKAARTAYDALTAEQKKLVTNYDVLEAAEKTYAQLKEQQGESESESESETAGNQKDQEAAKAVTDSIAALGTITLESEDDIQAARAAYDALTAAQKKLVTNYDVLEAAEKTYAQLKEQQGESENDQAKKDQEAAKAVSDMIAGLGNITLGSESKIQAARAAYDALTAEQKKLVANLDTLQTAETTLKQLIENTKTDSCVQVGGIKITGISKQIAAGKKIQLKADVTPANAVNKTLTWKSSNETYATVDANGRVSVKKAGKNKKVTITATANDGSGITAKYTIKIMPKAVKKIAISAKTKTVKAGSKLTLKAKVTPSKKINKKVKWTSSNEKYATVSKKGVVKTKKAGKGKKVKITAAATDGSNKKATIKISIK